MFVCPLKCDGTHKMATFKKRSTICEGLKYTYKINRYANIFTYSYSGVKSSKVT